MFAMTVPSHDGTKKYTVRKAGDVWVCDCPDHVNRSNGEAYLCKHLAEVAVSLAGFAAKATKSKRAEAVLSA